MQEIEVFKVARVEYNLERGGLVTGYFSAFIKTPMFEVRYKMNKWVSVHPEVAKLGYFLTAFSDIVNAKYFFHNDCHFWRVLLKCKATGIIPECSLPPRGYTHYDININRKPYITSWRPEEAWPPGTIMAASIKPLEVVEQIDPYGLRKLIIGDM